MNTLVRDSRQRQGRLYAQVLMTAPVRTPLQRQSGDFDRWERLMIQAGDIQVPWLQRPTDDATSGRPRKWSSAVLVGGFSLMLLLGVAMVSTDPWFTFLEDETSIVTVANRPVKETALLFVGGKGQHEHPPLSDLLVHFWLPVAGAEPRLLRLPSVIFFLAGILILASVASKLAGQSAWTALLWTGFCWPFGFQFGRLIGWYSFSFFLVALLTWAYFQCFEEPSWRTWLLLFAISLALIYTNYFGWAVIGCLVIDFLLRHRYRHTASLKTLLITLLALTIAYLPMARILIGEILQASNLGTSLVSRLAFSAYNLYSLFVSESIAPWFWPLSIAAGVAIAACLAITPVLAPREARYCFAYFLLLFAVMSLLGIVGTKRLLLISGWLLLPVACAVANRQRRKLRAILVLSMAVVAAVGWFGVISRRHYATAHFLEPWAQIARDAAGAVNEGAMVVSNSPSFLFYLNYSLQSEHPRAASSPRLLPGWVRHPRVFGVKEWNEASHPTRPFVLFIRGVNISIPEQTLAAESWLRNNCDLQRENRLLPDPGYSLKQRLFRGSGQVPFRIEIQQYRCAPTGFHKNS